jgi:MIP family channel proteins
MFKKIYAEFLGTFTLVLIGVAAIINNAGLLAVAIAHGVAIAVMVSALAGISGAHFNPAVSFAMLVTRRINLFEFLIFVAAQLAGASAAAALLKYFYAGAAGGLGLPAVTGLTSSKALLAEAVATFLLVTTIFGVAVDGRGTFKSVAGLPIGLMITLDILAIGPATGAAMNPARWFGPALIGGHFGSATIYIVGPLLGAAIAGIAYDQIAKPAKV